MKKVCIVEDNVVVNIILMKDDDDPSNYGAVDLGEYAEIGDTVSNGELININEKKIAYKRNVRNELLFKSDWMAVSDRTMTQDEIDYRQELRDLPEQEGFPDVDFPIHPYEQLS